jgi:hypothetical protein
MNGVLLLVAAGFWTASGGCGATVRKLTREAKPLTYIGQVQFGEPKRERGHVVVPLKYRGGAWLRNSAIVPVDVKERVKGREIEMTVLTSVHTDIPASVGRRLNLPKESEGRYRVFYRDPDGTRHEIGVIQIGE